MDTGPKYRFDPVDHNFMRLRGRLTPGERLLAMLAAREWVVSAHRARLQRQYPDLSPQETNLKMLERSRVPNAGSADHTRPLDTGSYHE